MEQYQPRLNRYQAKKQRKKNTAVTIFLSGELTDDSLQQLAEKNIDLFQELAAGLYDVHWSQWRRQGGLQISLQFLDEPEMAELNTQYRDVHGSTDVLTFPLFEMDGEFVPDLSMKPFTLGDIILCPAVIRRNAAEHQVSDISELALVIFHGMLHLLAWDHDTPERQDKMWKVQEHFRDQFLARLEA